jgi:hypothetical protein
LPIVVQRRGDRQRTGPLGLLPPAHLSHADYAPSPALGGSEALAASSPNACFCTQSDSNRRQTVTLLWHGRPPNRAPHA